MSRRMRRAVKRHKDLVWITTIVEATILEATPTDIAELVLSGDWSGGNVGFDRATILGVRGWLGYSQMAAATLAETSALYLAMYVTDGQVAANSMDASLATDYAVFDTLWTDGMALTATTGTGAPFLSRQLNIKSKRKITTASECRLAAIISPDAASSPRCRIGGCVRVLLMLDPPG